MAKTLKYVQFIALFFFIILAANLEMMPGVAAKVCKRYSKTWRGPCFSISNCNKQCKKKEKAVSGSCHADDVGWACFCYVNC